jgi:hypothetical protein
VQGEGTNQTGGQLSSQGQDAVADTDQKDINCSHESNYI